MQLREIRNKRGLSQEKLAAMSGVALGTISNIESGRYNCSPRTAQRLASALHLKHWWRFLKDHSTKQGGSQ